MPVNEKDPEVSEHIGVEPIFNASSCIDYFYSGLLLR